MLNKRHNMELERSIFNSARDGELHRLRILLDQKPKEEVASLVSARTDDTTPLVISCTYGHLDVALYLISECQADIDQTGSILFDGQSVEDEAPPLWCAAAAGHLNLVKILLSFNASVNATTKLKSTPLHAACSEGHFEIVKYLIEHGADTEIADNAGHTCLMRTCRKGRYEIAKYLVECGADINRKSDKGSTALHDCAKSGNLNLVKLLLQNGTTFISDCSGKTPLLTAALAGHAAIFGYFIQEVNISKAEAINALELLGATFVDKNRGMVSALNCWRQAMGQRYGDRDCVIEKPKTCSPLEAYMNATEVRTLSQLEDLILDPHEMGMQALLVRERVLGAGNRENFHYIYKRCAVYADNGDFYKSMLLWMYAIDTLPPESHPLELLYCLKRYSNMMSESRPFARGYPVVSFRDVLRVFERAFQEIERKMKASEKLYGKPILLQEIVGDFFIAIFLLGLMCGLQSCMSVSEEMEMKKAAYKLVRLNPRTKNDWTTLHFACFKGFISTGAFILQSSHIQSEVVNLLLEVGASPNVLDKNHNSPLHIAAKNKRCPQAVLDSLLSHGAHLDLCNKEKQTPFQLVQHMPLFDVYPFCLVNLQCLSAKAVQRHKIPYKGLVSKKLEVFLDLH